MGCYRPYFNRNTRPAIILGNELQPIVSPGCGQHAPEGVRIPREKVGGWARGLGRYQPRWIHSSRWGRSRPMVVGLPWPGSTWVSSGSVKSLPRMLWMMVEKLA